MLAYLLLRVFVLFFRFLPFFVIHQISSFLCFLFFHVLRIRRNQIEESLSLSFPEKKQKEICSLAQKTYQNACDVACETLKSFSMTQVEIQKRVEIFGLEKFEDLAFQKKSCVVYFSHMCNWEWLVALGSKLPVKAVDVYKRIHNKRIDDFVLARRNLCGADLVDQRSFSRYLSRLIRQRFQRKDPRVFILISDHRPRPYQESFEHDFLGRKTSFVLGPEKIAKKFELDTFYLKMTRKRRGLYRMDLIPLGKASQESPLGNLTGEFVKTLERDVKERPSDWFWFHNRWKSM